VFRKTVSEILLFLLLVSTLTLAFNIQPVKASGTVYIKADGSIDPPDAPISSVDNITYTLTGNITSDADGIVVERSNIIIDEAGYTLQGTGAWLSKGIDLSGMCNVTIINANIKGFYYGVRFCSSSNNQIYGNNITNNYLGIELCKSSNNSISGNNIATHDGNGISLDEYSNYNRIYGNSITYAPCGIHLSGFSNTVSSNTIRSHGDGIILSGSNNSMSGNNITNNAAGISLFGSECNNIFGNFIIHNLDKGVRLFWSSNNTISRNNITNNGDGILISGSSNNTVSENTIADNGRGVELSYSSNNTLKRNNMVNNTYNFGAWGEKLSDFVNDVDVSNTVDGRPVYYWTNRSYEAVPLDAGYVALINCTGITVQNLTLARNGQGLLMVSTTNSRITKNDMSSNEHSIELYWSSNNTVTGNNITADENGIGLNGSFNNTVSGNDIVVNGWWGISLFSSSNNNICRNNITNSGVKVEESANNNIFENYITASYWGILLAGSSNNILSRNVINGSKYGFGISGFALSDFMHCIDVSNLVDGKPMYYIVSQENLVINPVTHPKVGYLAFINCINITVEGLILTNQGQGILLVNTNNSKIIDVDITNCSDGLQFWDSSGITVMGNNITNNFNGIRFDSSFSNTISKNSVTNNIYGVQLFQVLNSTFSKNDVMRNRWDGIMLSSSNNNTLAGNNVRNNYEGITFYNSLNNTILGNNITNNEYSGISLQGSSNNKIYHNNFIDNTHQVEVFPEVEIPEIHLKIPPSINTWDDGYPSGGNFWSDYVGVDVKSGPGQDLSGSDGIGDAPYIIDANNTDRFPLSAPINVFDAGTWNGVQYRVDVVSNSTVSGFHFNPNEGAFLKFNVTGGNGTAGFCRVTIPKDLLRVEDGWTVYVGDELITDYVIIPDENCTYLYFAYNHTTKIVIIQGTDVIPEFPSLIIIPLFMIATLLAVIVYKRKHTI
jgi:parallel beta-helix repeat protein